MPPKTRPSLDRFAEKFTTDKRTGCWLWTNFVDPSTGYGLFRLVNRTTQAHRAAWELFRGPIPPGYHVDHLCRNKICVNPSHLEPVTPQENANRGNRARRTHCIGAGHPMTPENSGSRRDGHRYCKTCARDKARAKREADRRELVATRAARWQKFLES